MVVHSQPAVGTDILAIAFRGAVVAYHLAFKQFPLELPLLKHLRSIFGVIAVLQPLVCFYDYGFLSELRHGLLLCRLDGFIEGTVLYVTTASITSGNR